MFWRCCCRGRQPSASSVARAAAGEHMDSVAHAAAAIEAAYSSLDPVVFVAQLVF